MPRKTASNVAEQLADLGTRDAVVQLDVDADLADHLDLGEGELGRDLVGGDAQRVEAARQVACLEDDHVMPQPAQLVGAARARPAPSRSRPRVCRSACPARRTRRPGPTAMSQANRWRRPICTGAFISARSTQAPSQRTSVGQARAQLPPKMLASRIVRAAPISSWCRIWRMNRGTSI